jgi:hypothetical protein
MPKRFALALAAAIVVSGTAKPTGTTNAMLPPRGGACQAVEEVVLPAFARSTPRETLVTSRVPELGQIASHPAFWNNGWSGEAPSPALVRLWRRSRKQSFLTCDVLRERLSSSVRFVSEEEEVAAHRDPNVWVSAAALPVVDPESGDALYSFEVVGSYGSSSKLFLLRRIGGAWREVGQKTVYQQ